MPGELGSTQALKHPSTQELSHTIPDKQLAAGQLGTLRLPGTACPA
jgi:hypothetical protein